jgi:hypothetical protein
MSIEPIGLITILLGVYCLRLGHLATATVFVVATLLGAAAAMLIGAANIQPAHLFLAFVAMSLFAKDGEKAAAISALAFPRPGFWLMCLVGVGILSAFALPRLLAGATAIIPLGVSEYADTGSAVPLGPVYLTADLICFTMIAAMAATPRGFEAMASAIVACAAGNVIFAILDLVTYYTGTLWVLDIIRNAQYTLHFASEVSGMKRIVGSFPEASSFGRQTLGLLSFVGTLWVYGRRPALTGTLALASLILVVFSTSSAGLAGTAPVLLILYFTALRRFGISQERPMISIILLCGPLLLVALVLYAQLDQEAAKPIKDYLDELIFSKSNTASGIERTAYNSYAFQNFLDTFGLGVGLGTVRTSSFGVALLANVGILGTILYLFFALTAFVQRRGVRGSFPSDVRRAARNACLGLMIGDMLGAPGIEQGLLFYVLAAVACAVPEQSLARSPAPLGLRSGAVA